jgi:hypothetical protein
MNEEIKRMQEHEEECMRLCGWYYHVVMGKESSPTHFNVHTHGFTETFDHPDLQVVLPIPDCKSIFSELANKIANGYVIRCNELISGIIQEPYKIMVKWAVESNRAVLRLIFPDKNNSYHDDKIYAKQFVGTSEVEPVITEIF